MSSNSIWGVSSASTAQSSITTALTTSLATESATRLATTTAITSDLTSERTARINADATLTTNLSSNTTAIGNEVFRAMASESVIQGRLTTNETNIVSNGALITGMANFVSTNQIESSGSTLTLGGSLNTMTINLATSNGAQTVNFGTGSSAKTINIGGANDQIVIAGTQITTNTNNLAIQDKEIVLNKGGLAGSGFNAGIAIEEAGVSTSYIRQNSTRDGFDLKPANAPVIALTASSFSGSSNPTYASVAVSGTLTAQKVITTQASASVIHLGDISGSTITQNTANKRIVLWDDGAFDDTTLHSFYGLGFDNGIMRYQVGGMAYGHRFYKAISGTTSKLLMSINDGGIEVAGKISQNGQQVLDCNNSSGKFNTFVGNSGNRITEPTGSYNVGIGHQSLQNLVDGSENNAVGLNAGGQIVGGNNNNSFGVGANELLVSGNYNNAMGWRSLHNNQSGSNNVAIGHNASFSTTASNNICIGGGSNITAGTTNSIAIGVDTLVSDNDTVKIGNDNTKYCNLSAQYLWLSNATFTTAEVQGRYPSARAPPSLCERMITVIVNGQPFALALYSL